MKLFFVLILLSFISLNSFSQNSHYKNEVMTGNEILTIFDDSINKLFNIPDQIKKAYKYFDLSGQHYALFAETKGRYIFKKDTANFLITAIDFKYLNGKLTENWIIKDSVMPDFAVGQQNINFNFDILDLNDHDSDSLIDPIIFYSTQTNLFVNIFYKSSKSTIILQYFGYDKGKLSIDKSFYELPIELQTNVINKLEILFNKNPSGFPKKWQKSMSKKMTIIESTVNER